MLREEANAAVADAQGRGGKAVNVFAVQEIALQLLFSKDRSINYCRMLWNGTIVPFW